VAFLCLARHGKDAFCTRRSTPPRPYPKRRPIASLVRPLALSSLQHEGSKDVVESRHRAAHRRCASSPSSPSFRWPVDKGGDQHTSWTFFPRCWTILMAQSAQVLKVNHWHRRLADWLIVNAGKKKLKEAAEEFNVSQSWLSSVIHSDAFQDYFQRLSNSHSEALLVGVREKAIATADSAVSEIQRRLEVSAETIPLNQLLDISDVLLKRTGHGEPKGQPTQVNVAVGLVSKEELQEARLRMRERQAPRGTLELDAKDITPPSPDGGE